MLGRTPGAAVEGRRPEGWPGPFPKGMMSVGDMDLVGGNKPVEVPDPDSSTMEESVVTFSGQQRREPLVGDLVSSPETVVLGGDYFVSMHISSLVDTFFWMHQLNYRFSQILKLFLFPLGYLYYNKYLYLSFSKGTYSWDQEVRRAKTL